MTFGRLGSLEVLGNLGGGAGRAGSIPGAITDLWPEKQLYLVNNRRYSAFTDIPGESSSGGANGTVTDNGVITSASAPRIGRGLGLLVESASTNLLLYSEDFTNAVWSKVNGGVVTGDQVAAPDGALTADEWAVAANSSTQVRQTVTISGATAGRTYTQSVYLRGAVGGEEVRLNLAEDGGASPVADMGGKDLVLTTEWVRYDFTASVSQNDRTSIEWRLRGKGAAATVYVWGADFEQMSFASSYIPTAGSTVTRTADVVSLTNLDALGLTSSVVLDDDFSGYADQAAAEAAGYTFTGASFDAVNNQIDFPGAPGALVQIDTAASGLMDGDRLVLTWVQSNRTAGALAFQADGVTQGSAESANGTYTRVFQYSTGDILRFLQVSSFDGSIDSITIRRARSLNIVYDDGSTGEIFENASGEIAFPVNAKAYARAYA